MTEIELLARANGLSSIPSIAREKLTERCPQDRYRTERKLSVHELVISYEDVQTGGLTEAVHKVSLDMAPGEFVTIVGLSGCGKTSFLSAVAGLLKPRQGSIALNGAPVRGPGADRAVVFQKPSLLPWRRHAATGESGTGTRLRARGAFVGRALWRPRCDHSRKHAERASRSVGSDRKDRVDGDSSNRRSGFVVRSRDRVFRSAGGNHRRNRCQFTPATNAGDQTRRALRRSHGENLALDSSIVEKGNEESS